MARKKYDDDYNNNIIIVKSSAESKIDVCAILTVLTSSTADWSEFHDASFCETVVSESLKGLIVFWAVQYCRMCIRTKFGLCKTISSLMHWSLLKISVLDKCAI